MKSALSMCLAALAITLPMMMCLGACSSSVAIGTQAEDGGGAPPSDTANATGGASGAGGMLTSDGGVGSGGTIAAGGNSGSGGARDSGGVQGSGGVVSSGGHQASGGVPSTGGVPASGGMQGTGGIQGTGGMQGTGGIQGTGGMQGTGGGQGADAAIDSASGCPAQLPTSNITCSGTLTCDYGLTTCCGQSYPVSKCLCMNGTFVCAQAAPCNVICPLDAGSAG